MNKKGFSLEKWHFLKNRQTLFVFGRKNENAHFRCTYLFWENGTSFSFCNHTKSPNTTKIGVSAGTGNNPRWHFWFQMALLGFPLERGFYYLWYTKAVLCWKHSFYSVFSKTQLCRNKRVQVEKKHKFYQKYGVVCQHVKKVFFCLFFCFLVVVFYFLPFLCFLFGISPKTLFSCRFRVFFVPPKGLSLKSFFSSYSVLFPCFPFVLPFKFHILSLTFVHQPLFGVYYYYYIMWFLLSFFYLLPLPLFMFACSFQTNFPNIPFLKPKLLSFLVVSLFCLLFLWIVQSKSWKTLHSHSDGFGNESRRL